MPAKTPDVSKKGRNSQRGRGKGSGRCITASPAASVAASDAEPDEIHRLMMLSVLCFHDNRKKYVMGKLDS